MLDVERMATFREVVRRGSFSAAADALSLTQPAVSRQVALLERQVGQQLVVRSRRGARPTPAGELLASHTDAVLGRLAVAERELAELAGLQRAELRVGVFFTALAHLGPDIRFHGERRHPGLRVEAQLVDRRTAFRRLLAGELDLAVVFEHAFEPDPAPAAIEVAHLFTEPLVAILPAGHRLAELPSLTLADLDGETWIQAYHGGAARLVDHVLELGGITPARVVRSGHGDEPVEAQGLVATGLGVTVVHALGVWWARSDVVLRTLTDGPPRHIQAAVLRDGASPAARAILADLPALARTWT
jgi:DNA-binding transcriptional LysR family regulator